jgi:P-type Cu2+ transporter
MNEHDQHEEHHDTGHHDMPGHQMTESAHEHHAGSHEGHAPSSSPHSSDRDTHAEHGGGQAAHAMGHDGEHAGHVDHTGHEGLFRDRFWISLILTIPVLLFTPMLQTLGRFSMPVFTGSDWIAPVFAVIIFAIGGVPFLQMGVPELRNRQPGMMTLISLAIMTAFVYSLYATLAGLMGGFFWEMVTLIDIMLLGHWLEMRSIRQASGALSELAKLMPDTAERVKQDGSIEVVQAGLLQQGDLLLIRPGASSPADGEVAEGSSDVNEAMITGESRPVKKETGAKVIAGTINGDGSLRIRVTATGDKTALAGIMRLVEQAQQSKSDTQILADKAAGWLFYVALGVAALTAVGWTLAIGFKIEVLERVVTVLVIACPHALGLAVPLVVAISTSLGARNGILVRDRLALEKAREINVVIFDKTGTLTEGEFGVVNMATVDGRDESEALAVAAAVEGDSEHLIARGIRHRAEQQAVKAASVTDFEAIKGRGIKAKYHGHSVYVGGPRLLEMLKAPLPDKLRDFADEADRKGQSVVYLVETDHPVAAFALADVIRPESRQAIDRLRAMGVDVAMLTGDSQAVAAAVANELGIQTVFAEVLPEHKDQKVAELQKQGKRVAMVGDGVNDAPALTRADVGIAIGSGTDVAIESAGIILVKSNPLDVVKIFTLSRASYNKMIQNLLWATGYNVVALPLAAGVLAWAGILLSPAVGALLMSVSTIIVAINAQLLRRTRL